MWTEEHLRQRVRETATNASQLIDAAGEWESGDWEAEQTQHWFYCLTSVLEFERQPGEPLTSYVRRAMNA